MKDELLSLTKSFIKIAYVSGSGEIDKAISLLELVKEELPEYPFTAYVSHGIPSLLFSNHDTQTKQFKIILNAHLDVVSASQEQYLPYLENGKLYGRGAKDMKSGAAAMILLFKELGKQLPYPLGLQIVNDEETGGDYGTLHQIDQGIRGEFIITGEGSNMQIVNESKTRLVIKLIAQGKASHSGYPWLGDNAIWKLQRVVHDIFEKFPVHEEEYEGTTVNITSISTKNTIVNKTPADCEAIFDIRYTHENKDILEVIQSLLPEGVTLEVINRWYEHYTKPDNHYITVLQEQAQTILGGKLPVIRAHATSDMPFYSYVGCDGIEFGPIGANHHADNEWVDIESLVSYYQILKQFLLSVAKEVQDERYSNVTEKVFVSESTSAVLYKEKEE